VQAARAPAGDAPQREEALPRCIAAGFMDQLCKRRDQGTLDCDLVDGRSGALLRESVVQNAPLFVAASIREVSGRTGHMTLLGLATAVRREWIEEMFPEQVTVRIEHLFDPVHKRVSAIKLVRFHDLVIHHEHQREIDPAASGRCLAEAAVKPYFELPLFNHELKQTIARINLVAAAMPDMELPPADKPFLTAFLARAFDGLTLAKEAQGTPLRDLFLEFYGRECLDWINELAPQTILWPDGRKMKLLYAGEPRDDDGEANAPELQVKLHENFGLKEHPHICEGKLPVKLWLCAPDGKRLDSTFNWLAFKANAYPKLKPSLQKKFPGFLWI
jgi:ATP-dependent helicase HrpB